MRTFFVAVLAVIGYVGAGSKFSCKNMQGKDVDWFVALKLPSYVDNRKGRTFAYFDSTQKDWQWSPQPINSTESAIGATVQQLYTSDNKTTFKTAYNDDVPHHLAEGSGRGHSKGVLVFSKQQGFWLVHSVPRYPSPYRYEYPDSGSIFAQSFLCLTLSINELEKVANYLRFSMVTPFITNRPSDFDIAAPHLVDVGEKKSLGRSDTVFTFTPELQTVGGKKVKLFAKHKKFGKDLWHDLIAFGIHAAMAVETWRNGAAKNVGTQCGVTGYNVYDIDMVRVADKEYTSSKDHSKWGVSMNPKVQTVCIGDVNRQESQFKRGGGALCIEDKYLWRTFHASVYHFLNCGEVQERKTKENKTKKEETDDEIKTNEVEKPKTGSRKTSTGRKGNSKKEGKSSLAE